MDTTLRLSTLRGKDFTNERQMCSYKDFEFEIVDVQGIHVAYYNEERISCCVCIEDFKREVKAYFSKKEV